MSFPTNSHKDEAFSKLLEQQQSHSGADYFNRFRTNEIKIPDTKILLAGFAMLIAIIAITIQIIPFGNSTAQTALNDRSEVLGARVTNCGDGTDRLCVADSTNTPNLQGTSQIGTQGTIPQYYPSTYPAFGGTYGGTPSSGSAGSNPTVSVTQYNQDETSGLGAGYTQGNQQPVVQQPTTQQSQQPTTGQNQTPVQIPDNATNEERAKYQIAAQIEKDVWKLIQDYQRRVISERTNTPEFSKSAAYYVKDCVDNSTSECALNSDTVENQLTEFGLRFVKIITDINDLSDEPGSQVYIEYGGIRSMSSQSNQSDLLGKMIMYRADDGRWVIQSHDYNHYCTVPYQGSTVTVVMNSVPNCNITLE